MVVATAFSALSVYLFQMIAGRTLGTDDFAPISVMWTAIFLVFTVLLLPVEQYLTRQLTISGGTLRGNRTAVALVGGTVVFGIVVGVGFVLATLDRFFEGQAVFALIMLINLIGRGLLASGRGFLAGRRRFHGYAAVIAFEGVILVAASMFVALIHPTTVMFALAMSVGSYSVLFTKPFSGGNRGKVLPDGSAQGIGFLLALIFATGASQVVLSIGPIVVGFVGGTAAAISVFFVTFTLFRGPVTSSYNIVARVLPDFTTLAAGGQQHRLSAWAGRLGLVGLATMGLFGVSGWFLGPIVVEFLYGAEFRPTPQLAMLGAAGVGAALIALFLNQIYIARGETGRMAAVWGTSLAVAGIVLAVGGVEPVIRVGRAFLAGEATAMVLLAAVATFAHWRERT